MRPSPLPELSWHIAFASDSSFLDVAVDAAVGRGRTNGRRHSHRSGREERKCLIASQMSADAPEPSRTGRRERLSTGSVWRFLANQLRGLLTAAAYVLYQELRLRAARTAFRSAQVSTLREHLIKLGAWVESSVRRIVLHLPASCIHRNDWQIIARSLGAAPA